MSDFEKRIMRRTLLAAVLLWPATVGAAILDLVLPPPVDEGAGTAPVTVQLTREPSEIGACTATGVVRTFEADALTAATPGQDYIALNESFSLTLNAEDQDVEVTFLVTIIDDDLVEPTERVDVELVEIDFTCPSTVGNGAGFFSIVDNDVSTASVSLSPPAIAVLEDATQATMLVTLNGTGNIQPPFDVFVDFSTEDGSAVAGVDYEPISGTLEFHQDQLTQPIVVTLISNPAGEPNRRFSVQLSDPNGVFSAADETFPVALGTATTTVTFVEDDSPPSAPGEINLRALPGDQISELFPVDGNFPITLAAEVGTVDPEVMEAAGNATYSVVVPEEAEPGTTFTDTIELIDAAGITSILTVNIDVVGAEQPITGIEVLTPNQRELATLFDDVCPRLDRELLEDEVLADLAELCGRLRDPDNSDAQVAEALEAINPEEILAAGTVALRISRVQHGNLSQRINALRSGARGGVNLSALNLRVNGQTLPGNAIGALVGSLLGGGAGDDVIGPDFGRWGLFVNGNINFGEQDRTANEAGFDFTTLGVTAGADYRLRDDLILGAAIGYARVDADFDRAGGGLDVDSWSLSLFGTYFHGADYYVDGMINFGRNDYDSVRHIRFTDAQGVVDRTARGSTDGYQISASLAAGYDFSRGPWTFGPHLGTDYVDAEVGVMREQGAGAFDMIIGKQDSSSWTVNAGAHVSYVLTPSWGVLIPHTRFDYVREFDTSRDTVTIRLAADPFLNDPANPSPQVTLQSDRPDTGYFVWSVGTSAQFIHGISGFVAYQQTLGMDNLSFSQFSFGGRFERQF